MEKESSKGVQVKSDGQGYFSSSCEGGGVKQLKLESTSESTSSTKNDAQVAYGVRLVFSLYG
jgi:hypothetical protein